MLNKIRLYNGFCFKGNSVMRCNTPKLALWSVCITNGLATLAFILGMHKSVVVIFGVVGFVVGFEVTSCADMVVCGFYIQQK